MRFTSWFSGRSTGTPSSTSSGWRRGSSPVGSPTHGASTLESNTQVLPQPPLLVQSILPVLPSQVWLTDWPSRHLSCQQVGTSRYHQLLPRSQLASPSA